MTYLRAVSAGRLGLRNHLLIFGIALGAVAGIAVGVVAVATISRSSLCQPYKPCGPVHQLKPLVNNTLWRSSQFGFTLQYPAGSGVSVLEQDGAGLQLQDSQGSVFRIRGSSGQSPSAAINSELSSLQNNISNVATDTSASDTLLGSNVGYQAGSGAAYTGIFASPQGTGQTAVNVAIQAATTNNVTITATAIYDPQSQAALGEQQTADAIFNTIQWAQ